MNKKSSCRFLAFALAIAMVLTTMSFDTYASAAKKATIKNKSITINVGDKQTISIKNKNKKNTYKFTSNKSKVATVSSKGVIKGKAVGTAKITVKETYKKSGKKATRKLGVVTVKVKKKKVVVTPTPANSTTPSATPTILPSATPTATAVATTQPTPTPTPTKRPTPTPITDITDGIVWPTPAYTEKFDSPDEAIIEMSGGGGSMGTYFDEGGFDNKGYCQVAKDQYNGPTFFLDNRTGKKDVEYFVTAYIKAVDNDGIGYQVKMWGGNTYSESNYCDTGSLYKSFAVRRLSDKWQQIKAEITVQAGTFIEVRVLCENVDFCIDELKVKVKEATDDTKVDPEPTEPAPADLVTTTHKIDAPFVVGGGWEYTVNDDSSFSIPAGWRYVLVELPHPIDVSQFANFTLEGSADASFRFSFFDKFKSNLAGDNEYNYDGSVFDTASPFTHTLNVSTGYAKYIYIGSRDSDDLKVALKSITFTATADIPVDEPEEEAEQ